MPLRWVTWYQPNPSWLAALKSGFSGYPAASAASSHTPDRKLCARPSETDSGPPTPWYSSAPRSLSSARLKYGSISS